MYVRNYTQTYAGYTMTGQYEVTPADPAIGEEIWCAVLSLEVGGVDILNIVDPFIVQELNGMAPELPVFTLAPQLERILQDSVSGQGAA